MAFNRNLPYNDLPLLPGTFDYQQKEILTLTIQASENLAKLNGLALLLPNADLLMSPLLVKEATESNAIENINTTTQKVFQAEAIQHQKEITGPEKEVLHYRDALKFSIEKIVQYGGIPTNLLVELQSILEPTKEGVRKLPGTVIANGRTGEVIYTPPEGESVIRNLLANLETFMHSENEIHPLIKLGVLHAQFEAIHPFYDGNGRTGRILMILYLLLTEKLEYPVLFLSEYINRNKADYYHALQIAHETADYKEIILYILQALLLQSQSTAKKIVAIKDLMIQTEQKIKVGSSLDYHHIVQILFSNPYITTGELSKDLKTSLRSVQRYVQTLETLGVIQTQSVGRNTLISIPQFIELLK